MIIANPIYDSVFKYLLEDIEIAREMLETKTDDRHKLDYVGSIDDDLVKKILNRLVRAASDEQMRKNMDVEDEIENTIANLLQEKDKKIAERDKKIAEDARKMEEDARKMEEDARKMEEDARKMEEDARKMEEDARKIAEQEAYIAELKKQLLDKDK